MNPEPPPRVVIDLRFSPNVELISSVRRFVAECYERSFGNERVAAGVALATHELLENAVKYSIDGDTRWSMEVLRDGDTTRVAVRTRNRALPKHIESLDTMFEEMSRVGDAALWYQEAMRRCVSRAEGSGLGLARICAETSMSLEHHVVDDWIEIVARLSHAGGEP